MPFRGFYLRSFCSNPKRVKFGEAITTAIEEYQLAREATSSVPEREFLSSKIAALAREAE